jgi:hypothetical protein
MKGDVPRGMIEATADGKAWLLDEKKQRVREVEPMKLNRFQRRARDAQNRRALPAKAGGARS